MVEKQQLLKYATLVRKPTEILPLPPINLIYFPDKKIKASSQVIFQKEIPTPLSFREFALATLREAREKGKLVVTDERMLDLIDIAIGPEGPNAFGESVLPTNKKD